MSKFNEICILLLKTIIWKQAKANEKIDQLFTEAAKGIEAYQVHSKELREELLKIVKKLDKGIKILIRQTQKFRK